jgi:hypothetical protein
VSESRSCLGSTANQSLLRRYGKKHDWDVIGYVSVHWRVARPPRGLFWRMVVI